MADLSIMIKIGGQLEKSFGDAIRAAQSGLSGLNTAVFREMAEAGNISSAAAMEMNAAGKMFSGASREMASAGRTGALASREMASGGRAAAASSRGMADAGKGTASTFMEMATEGKKAVGAIRDIASTGKITSSSIRDIASAVKGVVAGFKDMSTQAGEVSKNMLAGGKETAGLSRELAVSGKGIFNLSKDLGKAGEMAGAASKGFLIAGAAIAATVAVAAVAGKVMKEVAEYSIQVGKEFETSMSDAAATANAGAEDFAKMEQAAMEMGRTTSKTASESAKALEYMSLAGWDVDTSVSALPSVLKMSEASGMDLARTSDLVTDSMAALGVTVDQLPGYLDVAAKAQTKSNQSTEQLMEAYIGVGGTMKNLGIPITESATALGVLANRGIKGSEAGNALNAVMVNLTTGAGQSGKMMQQLGVSAFDQQGKFIGLEETLQQLNTSLQGCSEEQRNAALAAIGGKQHIDALNDLMAGLNTTNEEGISEWAALTNELENCNGSLQAMRDMKLDNLEGDLKTLESATQDAGIKIYKHLNAPLREFAQFGTQEIYQVSDALERDGFAGMAGAAGSALAHGMGMVVERLPEFLAKAVVSTASFLGGFVTELPASLLTGIMKGVPRLLKALPGLGVDIVKAIIRGILSMGGAPLKAVKSLFFGGGDDADAEKADTGMPEGQSFELSGNIAAASDIPQVPQPARVGAADMQMDTPPIKRGGMFPKAGMADGMAGQGIDITGIATDASDTAESGPAKEGSLGAGTEQMPAGIPVATAQPVNEADMPIAVGTAPILQEVKNLKNDIPGETGVEMQAGESVFEDIPAESLPVPGEGSETQLPIDMGGTLAEALPVTDTPDMGESFSVSPVGMVQDIMPTPHGDVLDGLAKVTQISSGGEAGISMEAAQMLPAAMPDMPIEAGGTPAPVGITPDAEMRGGAQVMAGVPAITQDTASIAAIGAAGSQYMEKVPIQNTAAMDPGDAQTRGARLPSVSTGMALVRNAIHTGITGSLAGRIISAPKTDADDAALPSRQESEGVGQGIGGIIGTLRAGVGTTGINTGRAAQMMQIPLQGVIKAVSGGVLQGMAPNMADTQVAVNNTDSMPEVSPGIGALPAAIAVAQKPVGGVGAVLGNPDMAPLPRHSLIDEVLDILLGKRREQDAPASDTSPSFVYSPTFNIEGGGNVKKDVEEASQIGMREFDKMMQQWIKRNKRKAFA